MGKGLLFEMDIFTIDFLITSENDANENVRNQNETRNIDFDEMDFASDTEQSDVSKIRFPCSYYPIFDNHLITYISMCYPSTFCIHFNVMTSIAGRFLKLMKVIPLTP